MIPTDRILRQSKKVSKYNILDFVTHERYQNTLANTNHNFYLINPAAQGIKEFWNEKHGKIPQNYQLLPRVQGDRIIEQIIQSFPTHLTFDCIISHQKFGQFQLAKPISEVLQIPLISLEHTLPVQGWPLSQLQECRNMIGNFNVFITEFNKEKWGWNGSDAEVITHAIDTNVFTVGDKERKNHILTVANDYRNRDSVLGFQLYQKATEGLPVNPVGETPGLSKAPETLDGLVYEYQTSSIFLNTANWSPVPMSMLEAMSCGCAVVSLNSCACPDYIKHGENGFLANDDKDMKDCLQQLLRDEELRKKFGENARKTVEEKCSLIRFCSEWNNLFERAFNA